jgi:hypothetical protein
MNILTKIRNKVASNNTIQTIITNGRDFVILPSFALAFAFAADLIERFAVIASGANWLTRVGDVFANLSKLCVAHTAVFILLAIGWPTLNKWGNFDFSEAWDALPSWGKFTTYIGVTVGWFIGCAIVIN